MKFEMRRLPRQEILNNSSALSEFLADHIHEFYMTPSDYIYGRSNFADKRELGSVIRTEIVHRVEANENLLICVATNSAKAYTGICIASSNADYRVATIEDFAVERQHVRSGVGSSLLNFTIDNIRATGIDKIFAEVSIRNQSAMSFFLSNSFSTDANILQFDTRR